MSSGKWRPSCISLAFHPFIPKIDVRKSQANHPEATNPIPWRDGDGGYWLGGWLSIAKIILVPGSCCCSVIWEIWEMSAYYKHVDTRTYIYIYIYVYMRDESMLH